MNLACLYEDSKKKVEKLKSKIQIEKKDVLVEQLVKLYPQYVKD